MNSNVKNTYVGEISMQEDSRKKSVMNQEGKQTPGTTGEVGFPRKSLFYFR
jgi:hypothetical protein